MAGDEDRSAGRREYSPPTVSTFGEGIESTLFRCAREVVDAASARPGHEPEVTDPSLRNALRKLGVAVWGYEQFEHYKSETPDGGSV